MNTYRWRMALLAMLSSGAAFAADGQWVVVSANQANLQPGTVIDGKKTLTLPAGATVTLLSEDGKTLKLSGPHSGAPGATNGGGAKGELQVIAKLLTGHQQGSTQVGALRGGSATTGEGINLDGAERVTVCVSGDTVTLLRQQAESEEPMMLADREGKPLMEFVWQASEKQLSAPSQYFHDGQTYQIQRDNKTVTLQVYKAARPIDDLTAKVAWMVEKGCKAQALVVLQGL